MKNSFVMYTDYIQHLELMSDEQCGIFIRAVMAYAAGNEIPEMDGMVKMAFSFAKAQMDRDSEQYQKKVESRREAGKKGGRPKANGFSENQTKAKKANGFLKKQSKAKKADTVTDTDTVTVTDIKDTNNVSSSTSGDRTVYPYKDVIDHLNAKAGTRYMHSSKDTQRYIRARISDGFTLDDFYTVIDKKAEEWKGTEFEAYLRPATLFGTKFEAYLNQNNIKPTRKKNAFHNFDEAGYDYDSIVSELCTVNTEALYENS